MKRILSDEHKQKFSKVAKGSIKGPCSEERKEAIRKTHLNAPKILCNHCNKEFDSERNHYKL